MTEREHKIERWNLSDSDLDTRIDRDEQKLHEVAGSSRIPHDRAMTLLRAIMDERDAVFRELAK